MSLGCRCLENYFSYIPQWFFASFSASGDFMAFSKAGGSGWCGCIPTQFAVDERGYWENHRGRDISLYWASEEANPGTWPSQGASLLCTSLAGANLEGCSIFTAQERSIDSLLRALDCGSLCSNQRQMATDSDAPAGSLATLKPCWCWGLDYVAHFPGGLPWSYATFSRLAAAFMVLGRSTKPSNHKSFASAALRCR